MGRGDNGQRGGVGKGEGLGRGNWAEQRGGWKEVQMGRGGGGQKGVNGTGSHGHKEQWH